MNIEVVIKNVQNEAGIREFIEKKVETALARIGDRVSRVTVRLEDETRDSDAFDGLCHIDAVLYPTGGVHVSAHGDSEFESVLSAIRKMQQAIKHDIDRHRRSSRVRHQHSKDEFYAGLKDDEN